MNESTNLADLLALNLHNFEEEVRTIVDKATKELSMEKILAELNNTWSVMEVEYEDHYRTKISLLKISEELIETLEDNQVCLFPICSSHVKLELRMVLFIFKLDINIKPCLNRCWEK